MFLVFQLLVKIGISSFLETLNQFNPQLCKWVDVNHFNQILLNLVEVSNNFHYSILVCLHRPTHNTYVRFNVSFNVSWETRLKRQIKLKTFNLKD